MEIVPSARSPAAVRLNGKSAKGTTIGRNRVVVLSLAPQNPPAERNSQTKRPPKARRRRRRARLPKNPVVAVDVVAAAEVVGASVAKEQIVVRGSRDPKPAGVTQVDAKNVASVRSRIRPATKGVRSQPSSMTIRSMTSASMTNWTPMIRRPAVKTGAGVNRLPQKVPKGSRESAADVAVEAVDRADHASQSPGLTSRIAKIGRLVKIGRLATTSRHVRLIDWMKNMTNSMIAK